MSSLRRPAGRSACEGGAAEEDQIVRMGLERGENGRDQMVATDLIERDTKLLCDGCCLVT